MTDMGAELRPFDFTTVTPPGPRVATHASSAGRIIASRHIPFRLIANALGCSDRQVRYVLSRAKKPTVVGAARLADLLDMNEDDLLDETGLLQT